MPPEKDEDSTEEDFKVVPNNRNKLLLDWEKHINYAGTMLYLYKYLVKGDRKIKAITENISKNDDIKLYIRGMFPRPNS